MQTIMPLILALTFPGLRQTSDTEFGEGMVLRRNGLSALWAPENRLLILAPLLAISVTGLINWVVIEPVVVGIMRERKHQGMAESSLE